MENSLFHIYNVNSKHYIGFHSYKDQCNDDYFYGKDMEWETILSELESKWSNAFISILNNDFSRIDDLKEFIFQYARTAKFNNKLINNCSLQLREKIKSQSVHDNFFIDNEQITKITNEKSKNLFNPSICLEMIVHLKNAISNLSFLKVHYETNKCIISNDNPVFLFLIKDQKNPYDKKL